MTRRVEAHWRVSQFEGGQPFIVLEPMSANDLDLFRKTLVSFDLPAGMSYDEASDLAKMLNSKLIRVAETD